MIWTCETWNAKPYMKWAGARVVTAADGRSRVELRVEDHHRGAADTEFVNGAILAYLHDVAQGAAVRSLCGDDVKAIATLNLNISYVSFADAGELLVGEGTVLKIHSAVAFAQSEFRDADGALFCQASGTFRVMRQRASA